jgi:hypothetical protein
MLYSLVNITEQFGLGPVSPHNGLFGQAQESKIPVSHIPSEIAREKYLPLVKRLITRVTWATYQKRMPGHKKVKPNSIPF